MPAPPLVTLYDNYHPGDLPRVRWPDRPGQIWTPDADLPVTLREITVHWSEENTPGGHPLSTYLRQIHAMAYYHANVRNWATTPGAVVRGFGLMYHLVIVPTMPEATILHTQPFTLRTWNAGSANAHNVAVMLCAGRADVPTQPMIAALGRVLDWLVDDPAYPLLTRAPGLTPIGSRLYPTFGVRLHDEVRAFDGLPPKGCPGIYAPAVHRWRGD